MMHTHAVIGRYLCMKPTSQFDVHAQCSNRAIAPQVKGQFIKTKMQTF